MTALFIIYLLIALSDCFVDLLQSVVTSEQTEPKPGLNNFLFLMTSLAGAVQIASITIYH